MYFLEITVNILKGEWTFYSPFYGKWHYENAPNVCVIFYFQSQSKMLQYNFSHQHVILHTDNMQQALLWNVTHWKLSSGCNITPCNITPKYLMTKAYMEITSIIQPLCLKSLCNILLLGWKWNITHYFCWFIVSFSTKSASKRGIKNPFPF